MTPPLSSVIEDIGYGWAQIKLTVLGGGVWAADGAELLLLGAITNAVRDEWNLSTFQRGFVVSIVFLGVLVGNCFSGWTGDRFGRQMPIVGSYLGVFLASIVSVGAWSFLSLAVMRFLVGLSFGIGQPAWNTLASETTPDRFRVLQLTLGQLLFALGEVYSAALIYADDPDMQHLDWRWLIAMGSIPSAVLLALSYFLLPESPFFLASNDRMDEAQAMLKSLARSNGRPDVETEFQVVVQRTHSESWREKLAVVLGEHLLFTTLVMAFSTFNLNFLFYGGLYAFPQVLPVLHLPVSPATNLLLGAVSELPGLALGILLGTYCSRKNTMLMFCVGMIASLSCFLLGLHALRSDFLVQLGFISSKMMLCIGFAVVYVYCTEIYPTSCRTTGSSTCLACGRVGALVCPIAYELLTQWTGSFTTFFLVMIGLCIVNGFLFAMLPYETSGKALPEDLAATILFKEKSAKDEYD